MHFLPLVIEDSIYKHPLVQMRRIKTGFRVLVHTKEGNNRFNQLILSTF